MDRRRFLLAAGAFGSAAAADSKGLLWAATAAQNAHTNQESPFGASGLLIPDEGWRLWPDKAASWKDDTIYLPQDVKLAELPVNAPTGGWSVLNEQQGIPVTLPATVEQFYWGLTGFRPYHDEYKFESSDDEVKNGAYYGVSWWWRSLEIPASFHGKRIFLHVRAMRQRAEIYVNEKLVGYSIVEELPFECDITSAVKPGANRLAIRITNPGGRLDWVDGAKLSWGGLVIQKSHGFGGLDRALMLSVHGPVRVADCWALNTPTPRRITAHAELESVLPHPVQSKVRFEIIDPEIGEQIASQEVEVQITPGETARVQCELNAPGARIWDLDTPHVYRLRSTWIGAGTAGDSREVTFGFRWFAVDGLGANALFRLNGRRVRIYTSISWGFWALNGLFPIPELSEKEVRAAKQLNLNTLNFHRNLGKEDVLYHQDRMGLMRCLEPGGGLQAVGSGREAAALDSTQRYMEAKIVGMIRAFRSHPSVVHYILQNEARLDASNPRLQSVLCLMQREDPSRSIVGNDGFVMRSPQVWLQAYSNDIHASGPHATENGGAAGWWVDHTGHFSDVWQDSYYNNPNDFFYRSADRTEIVEWGEMKGAASSDNHVTMLEQIKRHGGHSYDKLDHEQVLAAYDTFLDRHGFRQSFPTASGLFFSIARRAYESWGQFMENVRICDENDMSAISGWESTAIENHSGLVDNFRDFKCDPRMISESLLPVRPLAKQRKLVFKPGESAVFDLYLLNDTNKPVEGELTLTLTDPRGNTKKLGTFPAPAFQLDQLSYLLQEAVSSEPLQMPGIWRSRFALSSNPAVTHERKLIVVAPQPDGVREIRVAYSGISEELQRQLRAVSFARVEEFRPGTQYDVIVASGGAGETATRVREDAEGANIQAQTGVAEAALSADVLAALKAGTPLLAITPSDGQATAVAKQLAEAGAFSFKGMVGPSRASWMGSWYFVRQHPLYDGLPVNQAMSIHYQVRSNTSNGWLVEGPGIEIVAAYARDHDRSIGAGTLVAKVEAGRVLLHRITEMHSVFAQRFVANALMFLAQRD